MPSRSHLGTFAALAAIAVANAERSSAGRIDPILISGSSANDLLKSWTVPFVTDPQLDVDFDRTNPSRLPFRRQLLNAQSLHVMVNVLREIICRHQLDCLITDCFFPVPIAAQLEGINFAAVLDGPAWLMSGQDLWQTDLSSEEQTLTDFCKRVGIPIRSQQPLPGILAEGQFVGCLGTRSMARMLPAAPYLNIEDIRFIGWPIARLQSTWQASAVDIVVTLGSLPVDGDRICDVLEALCGCGLRVGLTALSAPAGFEWVTPLGFAPSLLQLLTPDTLVLHHGGISSTLEALWAGCPAVALPAFPNTDQPVNATLIENLKIGKYARDPAQLRNCVKEVLHNPSIRVNARSLSTELQAASSCDWWAGLL